MREKGFMWLTCTYGLTALATLVVLVASLVLREYTRLWYALLGLAALLFPRVLVCVFRTRMTTATECLAVIVIFCSCVVGEALHVYDYLPMWDDLMHLTSGFLFCAFGMSVWRVEEGAPRALAGFCFSATAGVIWELIEYFCDRVLYTDMQKDTLLTSVASHLLGDGYRVGRLDAVTDVLIGGISLAGVLDIGLYDTMNDLTMAFVGTLVLLFLYRIDRTRGTHITRPFLTEHLRRK